MSCWEYRILDVYIERELQKKITDFNETKIGTTYKQVFLGSVNEFHLQLILPQVLVKNVYINVRNHWNDKRSHKSENCSKFMALLYENNK